MKEHRSIICIIFFLMFLWIASVVLSWFIPYNPLQVNLQQRLAPPSRFHLCGTDELGRDIFSRIVVGCKNTVSVSIMAFLSSFIVGVLIGGTAGYFYNTFFDKLFNWVVALLFSLPLILVIASLLSIMDKNLFNAYLVLSATIWASPARIVRAGVIQWMPAGFIMLERAMGKSEFSILSKSLLPITLRPAFIFSFKYFPEIIGMEAGLSFLGLGLQPPRPGLGRMVFDGINSLSFAWWYSIFPALVIFLLVCSTNLFAVAMESYSSRL